MITDFYKMFVQDHRLVTVNVLFYLPDYSNTLVNEFTWQTLDIYPRYPRVNKFLDYWRREIDAIIKEVTISNTPYHHPSNWRNGIIISENI